MELIFSGTDNVPENIAEVTVDLEINEKIVVKLIISRQ